MKNTKDVTGTATPPSAPPAGSETWWHVTLLERQHVDVQAKTKAEAIAVAQRDGFCGHTEFIRYTATKLPNVEAHWPGAAANDVPTGTN